MEVEKEISKKKVYKFKSSNLLVQTVCATCLKNYVEYLLVASALFLRRRLLILLILVISQIIIGCFVVYPLLTKDSNLKLVHDDYVEVHKKTESRDKNGRIALGRDRTIFVVTPTHKRLTQKLDLTSLSQSLSLVENLVWIVVEDSESPSEIVSRILSRARVKNVHLTAPTPGDQLTKGGWWSILFPAKPHKGLIQRNAALTWLKTQYKKYSKYECDAVVYFADDDNRYDVQLFEIMRDTRVVSAWPVGFIGGLTYEGPVCKNGQLISWRTGNDNQKNLMKTRAIPLDMAGFAINLCQITSKPYARFESNVPHGHLENAFLLQFISSQEEAECRGSYDEVHVWHVKTAVPYLRSESNKPTDHQLLT